MAYVLRGPEAGESSLRIAWATQPDCVFKRNAVFGVWCLWAIHSGLSSQLGRALSWENWE